MVRLVHVSDTHLGYQAYHRLDTDGLNQREVDLQHAFLQVVDWCVAHTPDLVVHSGDVFDSPRPSNRAIAFALAQVRRLSRAGIACVLLSGNHDAPRLRETGNILRIFDGIAGVHPVYKGQLEVVPFDLAGQRIDVHAVPQSVSQEDFHQALAAAAPTEGALNVLTVHGTVAGIDGLFTNELNDLLIPQAPLDAGFDYVALGHFHGARRVTDAAYYAGSTERTSIHEASQSKTFYEVHLESGRRDVRPVPIETRPMIDLGPVAAAGLDPDTLASILVEVLARQSLDGAIVRLRVEGVDRSTWKAVDMEAVRQQGAAALHLDIRPQLVETQTQVQMPARLGHLDQELDAFLEARPIDGIDRQVVAAEARRLLADAQEVGDAS